MNGNETLSDEAAEVIFQVDC